MTSAPTSRKLLLSGGAAACQIVTDGGTIKGHRLTPRPAKQRTHINSV